MYELLQQLTNGLVLASLYLLLAVGLSLIFGVLAIPHFGFGSVVVLSAYIAHLIINVLGFPIWISIILTILVSVGIGVLLNVLPYRNANELPPLNIFIISLGVMTFLNNTMQLLFGVNQVQIQLNAGGLLRVGPIVLTQLRVALILTAIFVMIITWFVLRKTKIGTATRAVAENRDAAMIMGINIKAVSAFVFGYTSAVGALVGIIYGSLYSITPTRGDSMIFFGFAAIILAGMGNLAGALVASLILGIFQALTIGYVSSTYSAASVFGLIILVLIFKPMGLFGKEVRR